MAAPMETHDVPLNVLKSEVFMELLPSEWRALVSKRVEVLSKDGSKHTGCIFTIDPVSKSIVLAQFPDDHKTAIEVIMGHAIHTLTVVSDATPQCMDRLDSLFQVSDRSADLTAEEISRRRADLKDWLEKHHIPVTFCGEQEERLSIAGALYIEPPYGVENCVSANEIILARVQALIQAQPTGTGTDSGSCNTEES